MRVLSPSPTARAAAQAAAPGQTENLFESASKLSAHRAVEDKVDRAVDEDKDVPNVTKRNVYLSRVNTPAITKLRDITLSLSDIFLTSFSVKPIIHCTFLTRNRLADY